MPTVAWLRGSLGGASPAPARQRATISRVGELPLVDIERIRVSAERDAYAALEREQGLAMRRHVPQDAPARRRALLSNALLLSETMAPEAHEAARAAMTALGIDDRVELFQSAGHGVDTARLVLYGQPIGVEFIGGYLDGLDRGGLLAVLGHEIGHALAHSGHPKFGWALPACERAHTSAARTYSLAAELTADRFGLLACRDLDAVLRLEMQMSAGRAAKTIRFDTKAYLEQCRAVAEETMTRGGNAMGRTHPEHYVRGYAEWLFTETDVYRNLTGLGPGHRSLDEVDAVLQQLIVPPSRPAAAATVAKPPPRASAATATPTSLQDEPRERVATEMLTDGARRHLAATRDVLATFARAAVPSIRKLADAAREQLGSAEDAKPAADEIADPLEDERRDLMARFEDLERRSKDK
ncbi:MAG: hypothetical protein JWP97_6516 [Labilithrix sp.]|nr:hypothetical protein [Labilithrix sp.]